MIKVLEHAIEKISTLSLEKQKLAAEVLEQIAASADEVYCVTEDERRLIQEGIDAIEAGHFVSEAEMAAFWKRNRP